MTREKPPELLTLVQSFFREHLESNCGASPHTIRAYRDTLRLLFCFMADKRGCDVSDLRLEDLTIESIQAFLMHLVGYFPKFLQADAIGLRLTILGQVKP